MDLYSLIKELPIGAKVEYRFIVRGLFDKQVRVEKYVSTYGKWKEYGEYGIEGGRKIYKELLDKGYKVKNV